MLKLLIFLMKIILKKTFQWKERFEESMCHSNSPFLRLRMHLSPLTAGCKYF